MRVIGIDPGFASLGWVEAESAPIHAWLILAGAVAFVGTIWVLVWVL